MEQYTELLAGDTQQAVQELKELDTLLLTLRLSLGKLRAALERAFAPLANVVLPPINRAIAALTGFVNDAAAVLAELFGFVRKDADKTVKVTGSALRRSLAGFDQLERLQGSAGGGYITIPGSVKKLPEELRQVVEKIRAFLKPLQEIDFSKAEAAFARLKTAIEPLQRTLFAGLEWLWFQVLTPMAQWGAEQALPVFLDLLTGALQVVGSTITAVKPLLSWLWQEILLPMGRWAGQTLLSALGSLTQHLQQLAHWLSSLQPMTETFTQGLERLRQRIVTTAEGFDLFTALGSLLSAGLSGINRITATLSGNLGAVASNLMLVKSHLSTLAERLQPAFKAVANAAIGLLNAAISGVEGGINAMVRTLNAFQVVIPDWIPGIGGKSFSMKLKTVDLPSVPYLAKGAVLPPNQPFLAVVGDQRHGTNVEAPLSVIEEAVAGVMGQSLATQDKTIALLQSLLTAVENISVGDETIGRAARRYERRMAAMGGVV